MRWQGCFVEDFFNRFGGKIDFFNLAINDGGSGLFAERDDDNLAGC